VAERPTRNGARRPPRGGTDQYSGGVDARPDGGAKRGSSRRGGCLAALAGLLVALALIGGGCWLLRAQLLPLATQLPLIGPLLPQTEGAQVDPLAAERARLTAWAAELDAREAELSQREQELSAREANAAQREDEADGRLSEALAIAASAERRSLELDNLVNIIESMKTDEAVGICNSLNEDLLLQLLAHMDGEAASKILAGLEPDVAARLVEQLGPDGLAGVAQVTD